MFKNRIIRSQIKQFLIFLNIILGFVLSSSIFYWFAFEKPERIALATSKHQYGYYSTANLPFNTGEIENDYFGRVKTADSVPDSELEDEALHKAETENVELLSKEQEDLIKQSDQLLAKVDNLLAQASENKQQDSSALLKKDKNESSATSIKAKSRPKISIIITNLGLNRKSTELSLTLPNKLALGFLPYTKTLKPLLEEAHKLGHEVYLYLPLQTGSDSDNPGKYALKADLALEENAIRLNMLLFSHTKYNGIYSSFKEVFTDNLQNSSFIFDQLDEQGLIFIMGKGKTNKVSPHFKSHNNIVPVNLVLDEESDKDSIKNKLDQLVKLAEKNGKALGYSQGFTITIAMIKDWIPTLEEKGIEIVPVSEILKENQL